MPNHGHNNLLNVKLLKESFTSLLLSAVVSVFAGLFLGGSRGILLLIPGLIIHIPVAIGMRGNIFAALSSRLGSALHLGSFTSLSMKNEVVRTNVYSTFSLTLILSAFLGFITPAFGVLFGIGGVNLYVFISIAFISGFISGMILLFSTLLVSYMSYKRGWDPDNMTAPLITALGDFFTLPSIIIAAQIVLSLGEKTIETLSYAIIAAALVNMAYLAVQKIRKKSLRYRAIVLQSMVIIMLAGVLDGFAGTFMELNIEKLVAIPLLLVLFPAFLEGGGNIGNILASRTATKLHLGSIRPELVFGYESKKEILHSMLSAYMLFPVIGFLTSVLGSFAGIEGMSLASTVFITTFAGILLHLIIIFMTFSLSIMAFKYGFDPDNTTIPIITSTTDMLGTFALLFVIGVIGLV